jgi:acetyl esterase
MPVTLDADAAAVFRALQEAGRPALETLTPDQGRQQYLASREVVNPEPPPLRSVTTIEIPGPAGPIPARLYRPLQLRQREGLAPGLIYFHGGGWVIGDLDTHDVVCRTLAASGELLVVSVDYRLAPEHKFPAAADDAIAAATWIAHSARELGIDPSRLVVGGDSAGGNLAAVTCIHAREAGIALAGQVLVYPATDFAMSHPSHHDPDTYVILTGPNIRWFRDHYLNGPEDSDHWKASPARVATLAGLPPAFVLTAGADPLHDEGQEFAERLKAAGVAVDYHTYPGQFHGFVTMGKVLPAANDAVGKIAGWLKALG